MKSGVYYSDHCVCLSVHPSTPFSVINLFLIVNIFTLYDIENTMFVGLLHTEYFKSNLYHMPFQPETPILPKGNQPLG